jgi:hypothetical protein
MGYLVRLAEEGDLDALAAFEVEIARISFAEDAVVDPQVHKKKLAKALSREREGMFVAVDDSGYPVGWLWITLNRNFLTGAMYANFRSLAVAVIPDRAHVGELLLERGLDYAERRSVTEVVGKVHIRNASMRVLYRKYGFEARNLTMRRKSPRQRV